MKIRWTEKASADALGIFDYIAEQSPSYADAVYERILARPFQLTEYPRSGSVVPELGREDVRELFVYSFRLIYRVATDEIRVLTVIHGSRELRPEMIEEAESGKDVPFGTPSPHHRASGSALGGSTKRSKFRPE